jgi:hypothetical protein
MSLSNIGPAVSLVASVKVSAATPPVLTNNVGVVSVTRTGAGIWVVTLNEQVDFQHRFVTLTPNFATDAKAILDPAVQTDTTIGVLGFVGAAGVGVATDIAWEIKVERVFVA